MDPDTTTGWTIGINFSRGAPALMSEKRSSGRTKMAAANHSNGPIKY
jgi:hypothetical protein